MKKVNFEGRFSLDVAYRWHRAAIDTPDDPRVAVAYRRKDVALRKASKSKDDEGWVERRAAMGEEKTLTDKACEAAAHLSTVDWALPAWLGSGGNVPVYCVSPLRLAWWWLPDPEGAVAGLCLGPHTTPELALAAAHAWEHWPALQAIPLEPADRYLLALHIGATRLVHSELESEQLDHLLTTVGAALLPLRGREEAGRAFLHRVAAACLDQPYGEIERIASGFHSGRTDRLHRAWERGFFIPRDLTVIARDGQPC